MCHIEKGARLFASISSEHMEYYAEYAYLSLFQFPVDCCLNLNAVLPFVFNYVLIVYARRGCLKV